MNKTVKMFNDDFELMLTDLPNLIFLDFEEEDVTVQSNTLEVKGRDGVLVGANTFGPFKLILNFAYTGDDITDYHLFKQKMRGLLFRREPFYITHSDMPGRKYAVYCESHNIEDVFSKNGKFEIAFNVYKGYSESLTNTLDVNFLSDNWQFENGLITDREIKYKHDKKRFSIWNGSNDIIDPLNHKLIIRIKGNAPNGFKMTNHTTGETFAYTGLLKDYQTLTLHGVNPVIGENRVGINTNHEWLTLIPGMNNFEIEGNQMNNVSTEFEFNFIYR